MSQIYPASGGSSSDTIKVEGQGTSYFNNATDCKVGIGTTSPGYKLEIKDTTANTLALAVKANPYEYSGYVSSAEFCNDSDAYNTSPKTGIGFAVKYNSGGSLAGLGSVVVGKANATDGNLDGYMGFVVRSASALSEKVRIDKDGNVGIGTTGPSTKLHVYGGELKVEEGAATVEKNYAGETYFTIRNTQAASGGSGSVVLDFDSADTNNSRISQSNNLMDIAFADHFQIRKRLAVTPNIYIDNGGSGGSVGIGTTSPAEKLEVNGGIKVGNSTGTNAGTIRWNSGTSKLQVYDGSSWVNLH